MRKIFTLLLMVSIINFSYAQEDSLSEMTTLREGGSASRIAPCPQWIYHPGPPDNRVLNPTFASINPAGTSPFFTTNINFWGRSHGTPQMNIMGGVPANFPAGANCASMWSSRTRAATLGEGIYGNLGGSNFNTSAVQVNRQYVLSFYRSFTPDPDNSTPVLDVMNIRLLKCQDTIQTSSTVIPAVPVNSQQVYCETNIAATGLQRVVVTFTANDNYDIIWIYPQQTTNVGQAWLQVTMIELTELDVFSHFTSGPGGLYLGLGPQLFNTTHRWYNQSNSLIATLNLGATQYDNYNSSPAPGFVPAGVSFGPITQIPGSPQTYVLRVTFLNAAITNNVCSTPFTGTLSSASTPVVWRSPAQPATATVEGTLEIQTVKRSKIWINNSLSEESNSNIYFYDLTGKTITTLYNKQIRKGNNVYNLDISVPDGIYIIKIVSPKKIYTKKVFINDL